jgi:hypothetical protein
MTEDAQSMRQLEHRRPSWLLDGVIVLLILAAWLPVAWYLTGGLGIVWYDTFRDMAWAENMRVGRIWADPVVAGQTWWYAPGGPLLAAAVARLTGWPVAEVYAASPAWCNGWIPAALYVLARVAWGRGTALLALATVLLGSYWWYTHVAAPIPGIQAVTLMLLVLLGWHLSVTAGRAYTWAAISGVLLALATWYHPMCGILPAFTIALQVLYDALRPRKCRQRLLGRMLVVAGTALVLTLPLIVHMLAVHAQNRRLLEYMAAEVTRPPFYAHAYTPLVVPAFLVGVWVILRHAPQTFWAVAYLLAALLLQIPAYLTRYLDLNAPYLLPHEAQWHMQIAEGLCAAVAIMWLARQLAQAAKRPRLVPAAAIVLGTLAVGPAMWHLTPDDSYFVSVPQLQEQTRQVRAWIQMHTALEDTIACDPELGYKVVSGLTGRKCIAVPIGQMNPAPDVRQRHDVLHALVSGKEPAAAAETARKYGARYLLFQTTEGGAAAVEPWDACPALERCFTADDGSAVIYRIRAEESP